MNVMYPNTDDFNIGYFEGQTKIWLVTSDDINSMYSFKYDKGGQITIWCDGRLSESNRETTRKQKHDEGGVGNTSSLRVCGTTSFNQVERRQVSSYLFFNTPPSSTILFHSCKRRCASGPCCLTSSNLGFSPFSRDWRMRSIEPSSSCICRKSAFDFSITTDKVHPSCPVPAMNSCEEDTWSTS